MLYGGKSLEERGYDVYSSLTELVASTPFWSQTVTVQ